MIRCPRRAVIPLFVLKDMEYHCNGIQARGNSSQIKCYCLLPVECEPVTFRRFECRCISKFFEENEVIHREDFGRTALIVDNESSEASIPHYSDSVTMASQSSLGYSLDSDAIRGREITFMSSRPSVPRSSESQAYVDILNSRICGECSLFLLLRRGIVSHELIRESIV